jgi:hypothetical protein
MRAKPAIAVVIAALSLGMGYYLGHSSADQTEHPAIGEVSPPATPSPLALVNDINGARVVESRNARALLDWLEQLRLKPELLTNEDRVIVYQAIALFGELRYVPSIGFLVAESIECKVGWMNPAIQGDFNKLPSFDDLNPHLASLSKIGAPAVRCLVDEYVRIWLAYGNRDPRLLNIELALGGNSTVGASLSNVNQRLSKANFVDVSHDELDAIRHLRQELCKRLESAD